MTVQPVKCVCRFQYPAHLYDECPRCGRKPPAKPPRPVLAIDDAIAKAREIARAVRAEYLPDEWRAVTAERVNEAMDCSAFTPEQLEHLREACREELLPPELEDDTDEPEVP